MQGIVFDQFREFANDLADGSWDAIRDRAGLAHHAYLVTENYSDDELESLIRAAGEHTGRSRDDLLLSFGEFIVPGLLAIYGVLLERRWDMRDLLLNTERVIHRVVRLRDPRADPPRLRVTEDATQSGVIFEYESARRMCSFGKGIIHGLAAHFSSRVALTDVTCMQRGDPVCRIFVEFESNVPETTGS